MLTTLRGTLAGWFLDITVSDDGSAAFTVGPFQNIEVAQRWERWLLIHAATVTRILSGPSSVISEIAWQMHIEFCALDTECLPVYHQFWMDAHPLTECAA